MLLEAPARPRFPTQEAVSRDVVGDPHGRGIPKNLSACSESHVTKVVCFTKLTSVAEGTACRRTVLDGVEPLGVLAYAVDNEWLWPLKVLKLLLW